MKKFLVIIPVMLAVLACSSKKGTIVANDSYGYSQDNPIKVGGVNNGPVMERKYLNSLTGPNGEPVSFYRNGSCCPFETKNGFMGGGMLDIYSVTYEGKGDTVKLYINMYDSDKLMAPKGFIMKQ